MESSPSEMPGLSSSCSNTS